MNSSFKRAVLCLALWGALVPLLSASCAGGSELPQTFTIHYIAVVAVPRHGVQGTLPQGFPGLQDGIMPELPASDAQASSQFASLWADFDYRVRTLQCQPGPIGGSLTFRLELADDDPWGLTVNDVATVSPSTGGTVSVRLAGGMTFRVPGVSGVCGAGWDMVKSGVEIGRTYGFAVIGLPSGERVFTAFCVVPVARDAPNGGS